MDSGYMRTTGSLLLVSATLLSVGCSQLPWPAPDADAKAEYCLSAGQRQDFDCSQPATDHPAGPLRTRDLPIDDDTLYARVEEVKRWLAAERARLSGETLPAAPQAPDTPAPAQPETAALDASDPEETVAAALALARARRLPHRPGAVAAIPPAEPG